MHIYTLIMLKYERCMVCVGVHGEAEKKSSLAKHSQRKPKLGSGALYGWDGEKRRNKKRPGTECINLGNLLLLQLLHLTLEHSRLLFI